MRRRMQIRGVYIALSLVERAFPSRCDQLNLLFNYLRDVMSTSFFLLLVRHLLLEAMHLFLVA